MKEESPVQDLLDFLLIDQKEMAEFFNISFSSLTKSAPCLSLIQIAGHVGKKMTISGNWDGCKFLA